MAFVPVDRLTLRLCLPPRPTCLPSKLTSRSYLGRSNEKVHWECDGFCVCSSPGTLVYTWELCPNESSLTAHFSHWDCMGAGLKEKQKEGKGEKGGRVWRQWWWWCWWWRGGVFSVPFGGNNSLCPRSSTILIRVTLGRSRGGMQAEGCFSIVTMTKQARSTPGRQSDDCSCWTVAHKPVKRDPVHTGEEGREGETAQPVRRR